MKKLSILFIFLIITLSVFSINAEGTSMSITGNDVSAGDTLTVTLKLNGSNITACQGTIKFDNEKLQLITQDSGSFSKKIEDPWLLETEIKTNECNFVLSDNNLENPINSETELFTVSFTVNQLEVGTDVSVIISELVATIGEDVDQDEIENITYSTKIKSKSSDNNLLKELKVTNAVLNPTFDKKTVNYTASVPFSVEVLEFTAIAEDDKATVKATNPKLIENGKTNVTIDITSESGLKKTYTIVVTRAKNPNAKSDNNNLSSITSDYQMVPEFSQGVTEYSVEVPYDVTNITFIPNTADSKSTFKINGGESLAVGDNIVIIECVAENGAKKEYRMTVKRLSEDTNNPPVTLKPEESPTVTLKPAEPTDKHEIVVISDPKGLEPWIVIILVLLFTGLGFVLGLSVNKKDTPPDNGGPGKPDSIVAEEFGHNNEKNEHNDYLFTKEEYLKDSKDEDIYNRFQKNKSKNV